MNGYLWNLDIKAYDITSRAKRRAYHLQMESIREVNARIMRKNLRRVFRHQKQAVMELEDPTDMIAVQMALHSTDAELRKVFEYSYQRIARDVYPMLVNTPKAKNFVQLEYKKDDPAKQYYDIQLAQWVETNLGMKITEIQNTTAKMLNKTATKVEMDQMQKFTEGLRDTYTLGTEGYQVSMSQSEFRDEVLKAYSNAFDTNISIFRANCISRTECASGTNRAALETSKALGGNPRKEWMAVLDMDTRDTHSFMNGVIVDMDQMFNVSGNMMDCPLDSTHGADVSQIANCRCTVGFHYD